MGGDSSSVIGEVWTTGASRSLLSATFPHHLWCTPFFLRPFLLYVTVSSCNSFLVFSLLLFFPFSFLFFSFFFFLVKTVDLWETTRARLVLFLCGVGIAYNGEVTQGRPWTPNVGRTVVLFNDWNGTCWFWGLSRRNERVICRCVDVLVHRLMEDIDCCQGKCFVFRVYLFFSFFFGWFEFEFFLLSLSRILLIDVNRVYRMTILQTKFIIPDNKVKLVISNLNLQFYDKNFALSRKYILV